MSNAAIQVDYPALEQISQRFAREAERIVELEKRLSRLVQRVGPGVWQGEAAERFAAEADGELLPTLRRLGMALDSGARTTQDIGRLFREAEAETAALFEDDGSGVASAPPPLVVAPVVERYVRLDEIEQLRGRLARASGIDRLGLQLQIAALEAEVARDGATAQTLLAELAAATTEEEREAIRARLRDDPALMEGLAATLSLADFRRALTTLQVNQPGTTSHTDATTADTLIRTRLADYVDESNQVQGNVAIVDDANWKAATAGRSPEVQGSSGFVDGNAAHSRCV